jgi:urease accessory protein
MIAKVSIKTVSRRGKTILKNAFANQPFKLADITEDNCSQTLQLMLMSSSPGVLDNDKFEIKIELQEDCSLELQTQSYQRLFQMKSGASQEIEVVMGKSSSFIFLPHPSVPHEGSVFSSRSRIYLSENCHLIWGEVLTCGRKLNGEVFRFSKYHSQSAIFLSGKLVVKENLLISPSLIDVGVIGQLEGYTHQGNLTCLGDGLQEPEIIESILELLSEEKDICFGASALTVNGFIVRLLGFKAEKVYLLQKLIVDHVTNLKAKKRLAKTPAYAK